MKEFNLEKAEQGYSVVTRDGGVIDELQFERKFSNGDTICGFKTYDDGVSAFFTWKEDGKYSPDKQSDLDLFMDTVKKEAWFNIYKDASIGVIRHSTKEEAVNCANSERLIDTVKVEWEE